MLYSINAGVLSGDNLSDISLSVVFVWVQLHHSLQQRAQKRAGQVLNMEEISTRLARLHGTVIAMPGLQANSIGPVSFLYMLYLCSSSAVELTYIMELSCTYTKHSSIVYIYSMFTLSLCRLQR